MSAPLLLEEIGAVLGVAKGTASRLRAGSYGGASNLPARYAALLALVERQRAAAADAGEICRACPRQDCTGCRIAEMYDGGGQIGSGVAVPTATAPAPDDDPLPGLVRRQAA